MSVLTQKCLTFNCAYYEKDFACDHDFHAWRDDVDPYLRIPSRIIFATASCITMHAKNPFTPGAGLPPPYLAGRDGELKEFSRMLQSIKDGGVENAMIHGVRGVGKTVLLLELCQICLNEGFLPVLNLKFDRSHSDPKTFLKIIHACMERELDDVSRMIKIKNRVRKIGKYVKPKTVEIAGVSYSPMYDSDDDLPIEMKLVRYLSDVWKSLEGSGFHGVVLLFDEFHSVKDENGCTTLGSLIGAINELQIKKYRYSLILCGLPPMISNVKKARSYSERMFGLSIRLSSLDDGDAEMAISEPLRDTPWRFSKSLISVILKDSCGYPYFIQFISKQIIDLVGKQDITVDDYLGVRDLIMQKLGDSFFVQRMESLSVGQRDVLYAMASVPDEYVDFTTICEKVGMSKATIQTHLRRLDEKGMVYRKERGRYQFSMPLLREYLNEFK